MGLFDKGDPTIKWYGYIDIWPWILKAYIWIRRHRERQ